MSKTTTKAKTNDMEVYVGNLIIRTPEEAEAYRHLKKVTGHLSIYSSAKLDAPLLESVGGYLSIYSSAKLDAPLLESVGGYLYINSSAKLDALKSVGGGLYISSSAKLDAPLLESVGGYLYISSSAKLDAPLLESVGGYLSISSSAKLDALKSVGGYLYISSKAAFNAPKLYPSGFDKFKVYDGIGCVTISTKQISGITVHYCRRSKIKKQKIVGDKMYVAEKDGQYAHAETIKMAVAEIQFKTGNRDISEYKQMPMTTKKTPIEWAMVYRMVTGACQFGVKDFMERRGKLKKQYTLKEILEETNGAYGSDRFRSVVMAKI